MKAIISLFALLVGYGAMAQETETVSTITHVKLEKSILSPQLCPIYAVRDADTYFRRQLQLNKSERMNIWVNPEVSAHVSKDLPFTQILTTGSVYTFDHIRYTVR